MKQVVWGTVLLLASGWCQSQAAEPGPSCTVRQVTIPTGSDAIHSMRQVGVDRHQFMTWFRHAGRSMRHSLRRLRPGESLDVCLRDNGDLQSLQPTPRSGHAAARQPSGGDKRFAGVVARIWSHQEAVPGFAGVTASVWPGSLAQAGFKGVQGSVRTVMLADTPAKARASAAATAVASTRIADAVGHAQLHTTELKTGHLLKRELAHYLGNHLVVAALADYVHQQWHLPSRLPKGSLCTVAMRPGKGDSKHLQLAYLQVDYRGHRHRVYHYVDAKGHQYVVGSRGEGYRVVAPAQPVRYTRISSGWGWRIQPVLGGNEFHHGIDYAAPAGTPIRASMDGVVEISGWHGNYGRLVEIRHTAGVSTRYGHLRGFAANVHVGSHVHRGEVIGYVGASGLSTGPHLYYEIWQRGQRINPLTHKALMVASSLPASERIAFDRYVDQQAMR